MAYTYQELHEKTVAQLRELAGGIEHDVLHGFKTMHKQDLLLALCKALGIEAHEYHDVLGVDKSKIKTQIRAMKAKRDAALEAGDPQQLKFARHNIRRLKRKIRRHTL